MATNKPRITITLNPRTYNVIKVISECGDNTMSGFVSEMLDAAIPTLERMAVTFQNIKKAQHTERSKFIESMDRAQTALEPAVMEAIGQFDLFLGNVDAAVAGGAPARGEVPAAAVNNPRPVTRGSTPLKRKTSAATQSTTKARSRAASGSFLEKSEAESVADIKAKISRQQGRGADAAEYESYSRQEAKKRVQP